MASSGPHAKVLKRAEQCGYGNRFVALNRDRPWRPVLSDSTGKRLNPRPTPHAPRPTAPDHDLLDKLRPHYQMLMDTYEAEFVHGNGLQGKEIIAFFNDYVHESLAGFHKDVTLPTDPRCIYVGGDREIKYANATERPGQSKAELARAQEAEERVTVT